jgi:hypothetical protein
MANMQSRNSRPMKTNETTLMMRSSRILHTHTNHAFITQARFKVGVHPHEMLIVSMFSSRVRSCTVYEVDVLNTMFKR